MQGRLGERRISDSICHVEILVSQSMLDLMHLGVLLLHDCLTFRLAAAPRMLLLKKKVQNKLGREVLENGSILTIQVNHPFT
jgi:hypothetical protein